MKQYILSLPTIEATDRNLYLSKEVNQSSIEELVKNIIKINEEDERHQKIYDFYKFPYERPPIKIYLDTYGGLLYQTFGLVSVMESSKTPIHTIVTGCAMSAGFIILISGHRRFAYKMSTPLYHQASTILIGEVKNVADSYIEAKRVQYMMEKIVVKKTRITRLKLRDIYNLKKDWYMTSSEAKRLGVVDEII
ncbi:MAG TPA: ATP-dependent Clp protease proteolytic subunit [Bacteroidales bacterium]|nr:ATP-dependent Clp protease proteolytic subunit [Bacteroidales bacterium]